MRLSEEQYREMMVRRATLSRHDVGGAASLAKPKPSKYRNVRCQSADGKKFQSKLERRYYEQLLLEQKAGEVLWFIRQPRFDLEGGVIYRADFLVVRLKPWDGRPSGVDIHVIDTKGCDTPDSINKRKQVKARYGIDVQIVRKV